MYVCACACACVPTVRLAPSPFEERPLVPWCPPPGHGHDAFCHARAVMAVLLVVVLVRVIRVVVLRMIMTTEVVVGVAAVVVRHAPLCLDPIHDGVEPLLVVRIWCKHTAIVTGTRMSTPSPHAAIIRTPKRRGRRNQPRNRPTHRTQEHN